MSDENVVELGGANWDNEVVNSETAVLVDFWAEWCGPCKALAPTVHEVAAEMLGKLKVGSVDVDANGPLAAQFGVRSIPTLLLIKDGEVKETMIGMMSKSALVEQITPHV